VTILVQKSYEQNFVEFYVRFHPKMAEKYVWDNYGLVTCALKVALKGVKSSTLAASKLCSRVPSETGFIKWPPGVDVMISIFCDFLRKNWRFSQNQCYDQTCMILLCFETKTPTFFAEIFGENIFKIITSVPARREDLPQSRGV
jgi:hypothetical protein